MTIKIESSIQNNSSRKIINPQIQSEDRTDKALRPKGFNDYVGQSKTKSQLKIFVHASLKRKEALDHVLLFGPPGLGKTTLANIIAYELGANIHYASGPTIEKAGDLAAILTNLSANDVLFIDEIHRISPALEEILYPALEDYQLDLIVGSGVGAKSIKIDLAPFTLIAATTRAGMLTNPLRDRFGISARLEFYSVEELADIIKRSANILNIIITLEATHEIAKRSRGTPRIANRLLRRVRDYSEVADKNIIDIEVAIHALEELDVDPMGLDFLDKKFLETIITRFNGGPVGLENIAANISESIDTIEDVIEPYLMQVGLLQRTNRGRVVSNMAYSHLGYNLPHNKINTLF